MIERKTAFTDFDIIYYLRNSVLFFVNTENKNLFILYIFIQELYHLGIYIQPVLLLCDSVAFIFINMKLRLTAIFNNSIIHLFSLIYRHPWIISAVDYHKRCFNILY